MTARRCILCAAAGHDNLGAMRRGSLICQHHHAALRATGRRWCPVCRRAVADTGRRPKCKRPAPPAPKTDRCRAWRERHPEQLKAARQAWYAKNREHVLAYQRERRAAEKLRILRGGM